jgi:hypothetical protein
MCLISTARRRDKAFSSEVRAGSRQENASVKIQHRMKIKWPLKLLSAAAREEILIAYELASPGLCKL